MRVYIDTCPCTSIAQILLKEAVISSCGLKTMRTCAGRSKTQMKRCFRRYIRAEARDCISEVWMI